MADLFERTTVERIARHWSRLLESAVEDPERRISELEMLSAAERGQLLEGWNDTAVEYPRGMCVHELFEGQVEKSEEAIAVVYEGAALSYGELSRKANQVGHALLRLGVGPEVRVGVCLERSLEMMVAVLGVLKAGGAYVPLDPSYPLERLGYMLDDATPGVVLTQSGLVDRLPGSWAQIIKVDEDEWMKLLADEPDSCPEVGLTAENLAYVIYTSGSTGQPKGVGVTHRGGLNLAHASRERLELKAGQRCCSLLR